MKKKVRFLKKQIDWIISHLFLIIGIIVAIVLICLKTYIQDLVFMFVQTTSTWTNGFITDLIILIISGVSALIFSKLKAIKTCIPRIKSYIYVFLLNTYNENQKGIAYHLIPKIIKLFYNYQRFCIDDQQQITNNILDNLSKKSDISQENIFWIIGDGFSGKTSAVLNLLTDLITKSQYNILFSQMDGHIEYFDFGRDDCDLENFYNNYSNGKYEKSMLIIDNVHKITQDSGLRIINSIVRNFNAFSIIILMRNPGDFIMQKENVEAFERTIQEIGYKPYILNKIQYNYDKEKDFQKFIKEYQLEDYSNTGTVLFHFIKLFIKSEKKPEIVKRVTEFLNANRESDYFLLLQYIIVSSLFTGSFNVCMIQNEMSNGYHGSKIRKQLHELYDIGFLNSYPNENTTYFFFHEELAKFYFFHTYHHDKETYNGILKRLYQYYDKKDKPYLAYLYSFLICDEIKNTVLFEKVVINVNYKILLKEIRFLLKINPLLRQNYHNELGILYDRSGELYAAQEEYRKYYSQCCTDEKANAFFKIVQVDHNFYALNLTEADEYKKRENSYDRLLAQYWSVHMNMHYGKFEFNKMNDIIREVEDSSTELLVHHPYDGLHLVRRIFFDFFRLYYIQGIMDYRRLTALKCLKLQNVLRSSLEEYQAYYYKFVYGHYLLYDVLYRLGIFGEYISQQEYNTLFQNEPSVKYEDLKHTASVIQHALDLYKRSYDFLYKIGDKTYYFVNCRYMEALAASGEYESPRNFYLEFKAFAINEQVVYYQACAEIYLFKLEFIHLFKEEILMSGSLYSKKVKEASIHLENANKYYREADKTPSNKYAQVMLGLYDILFSFYTCKKNKTYLKNRLKKIKEQCEKNNYLRELRIIRYIEQKDFALSPGDLKNIISYYPIVAQ